MLQCFRTMGNRIEMMVQMILDCLTRYAAARTAVENKPFVQVAVFHSPADYSLVVPVDCAEIAFEK